MTDSYGSRPSRVLVTATPPTPNGDLHVGHLSGPYLGADIYCRYLRLRGVECRYISGSDDHQSYTAFKGEQLGWKAAAVADHFGEAMHKTLKAANMSLDLYARPRTSAFHIPFVQNFFLNLWSAGKLVVKDADSLFCDQCNRYVFEAFVSGKCPHCHHPSGGNACEDCGRPNDCVDLLDPICKSCGHSPGMVKLKRIYFPLSHYHEQLERYYKSADMKPHLQALCEQMLLDGLPDIALTHHTDWGIPVPLPEFQDQKLYVWFEMAPAFLAATQELNHKLNKEAGWANYWKEPNAKVVHFFGFDNGYFFAVLFPALFLAYDPDIRLAQTFVTNEFYRLDGSKFSTSRNHAIWGPDLLTEWSSDAVRFYLAYTGPEREQSNFTREHFNYMVQREPLDTWQAWLQDLGARLRDDRAGRVPVTGELEGDQKDFMKTIRELMQQAEDAYSAEAFSPQRAIRICCELVRIARRFGNSERHWRSLRGREVRAATSLALELRAAKVLAIMAAPVVPIFAAKLWEALGHSPAMPMEWEDAMEPLPVNIILPNLSTLCFEGARNNLQVQFAAY